MPAVVVLPIQVFAINAGWVATVIGMPAESVQSHSTHRETAICNAKAKALGVLSLYVESSPQYQDLESVTFTVSEVEAPYTSGRVTLADLLVALGYVGARYHEVHIFADEIIDDYPQTVAAVVTFRAGDGVVRLIRSTAAINYDPREWIGIRGRARVLKGGNLPCVAILRGAVREDENGETNWNRIFPLTWSGEGRWEAYVGPLLDFFKASLLPDTESPDA